MALGYIVGKTASKVLDVDLNVPLILTMSIISDIDLLLPGLEHRGPTHSLIFVSLFLVPSVLFCKEKAIPYFLALIQHSILGDLFTGGGVQLFWPLSFRWYGVGIEIVSLANILVEWTMFFMFLAVMFKAGDLETLFQHHTSNMLLCVPVLAIVLPVALGFPLHVPMELAIPHIVYLVLFAVSILIDFRFMAESFLESR